MPIKLQYSDVHSIFTICFLSLCALLERRSAESKSNYDSISVKTCSEHDQSPYSSRIRF